MRKGLPLSALITGLLAGSTLGAVPLQAERAATAEVVAEAFPVAMPREVEEELKKLARGEKLNANGMQSLQRRLAVEMQGRLAQLLPAAHPAGDAFMPAQVIQFGGPVQGDTVNLIAPVGGHKEKAAFLGVATSPASATLRAQLNISRGMGLVVDLVEKDSPAESAGVQVHDILQKFDDQVLVNAQQLAVLVRSKKPGEEIKLSLLRAGKAVTVSAKLVEKEVPVLEEMEEPRLTGNATPVPEGLSPEDLLRRLPQSNTAGSWMNVNPDGTLTRRLVDDQNDITMTRDQEGKDSLVVKDRQGHTLYEGTAEKADLEPDVMKKIQTLRQQPTQAGALNVPGATGRGGTTTRNLSATRVDDKYQITITSDGKTYHVVAKDLAGVKVFEGGADSEGDFKAMPGEVEGRVRGMMEKIK